MDKPKIQNGVIHAMHRDIDTSKWTPEQHALLKTALAMLSQTQDEVQAWTCAVVTNTRYDATLDALDETEPPVLSQQDAEQLIDMGEEMAKASLMRKMVAFFGLPEEYTKEMLTDEMARKLTGMYRARDLDDARRHAAMQG